MTNLFFKECLYIPVSSDDKGPNFSSGGPKVGEWDNDGTGCYTYEEKEEKDWHRWGIVETTNDSRLVIIDVDLYKMEEERKKEVIGIMKGMKETRVHRSQSGGIHMFYFTDDVEGMNSQSYKSHIDKKFNGYVLAPECVSKYNAGYKVVVSEYPSYIEAEDIPEAFLKDKSGPKDLYEDKPKRDIRDIRAWIKRVSNYSRKFRKLFNGKTSGYESRSEAEYALLSMCKYMGLNKAQSRMVMNLSNMGKWHEEDNEQYREYTLNKLYGDN